MAKWTHSNWDIVMSEAVKKALTEVAIDITRDAKAVCPVGQYPRGSGRVGGRLKASITWATKGERTDPESHSMGSNSDGVSAPSDKWTAYVGTNVEYAIPVEYGRRARGARTSLKTRRTSKATRGSAGAGFMRRGLDQNRAGASKRLKVALHEAILKHGK